MRRTFTPAWSIAVQSMAVLLGLAAPVAANALLPCATDGTALGVSRIVEINTSSGPLYGAISTQVREPRFLGPKEVVLTFDDGPLPAVTRPILDTLDRHCTKATFFSVGRMAIAYPETTREIMARGHTLGTHTWSHPLNLKRLSLDRSREEIEKGHAAVSLAAGRPIAPFFRFPGLSDSGPMLRHLQVRGIGAFTVDVVSNDSYIGDADRLLARTLREVENQNGGIVLFHDIKAATARMLPRFLTELRARGYKVVHMRPKEAVAPIADYDGLLAAMLAKTNKAAAVEPLMPFYGRVHPGSAAEAADEGRPAIPPVAMLSPAAREREAAPEPAARPRTTVAQQRRPQSAVRGWVGDGTGAGPKVAPDSGPWAPSIIGGDVPR